MAKSNIVFSMILNNTDFVKKLNLSRGEMRKLERQVNGTTGTLSNMVKGGLAPMLGPLAAVAGGTAAVGMAFARATEKTMALDSAMAEMAALLGATEEQMQRFKTAAIGMASSSTVAADEVIRAMIKVGSAMPQLLDFEEGLKAVTQSAVTLSEASGMTLDDSINSLTSMMNQFGAAAMDSERYINVLAAAAQAGSAEIDYLSMAISKAGGAATSADMEFEELVALIEAIAPKFGKAEEAGTALRGVLLKMETGGEKTKISTQGLAKALDELEKMSTDELLKKFGVEGFNMAKAMIAAKDSFANFNREIRGTDSAHEQAELRANNLSTAIETLANKWDAFTLSINNSAGPLTNVVTLLGKALDYAQKLMETDEGKEAARKSRYEKEGFAEANKVLDKYKKEGVKEVDAIGSAIAEVSGRIAKVKAGLANGSLGDTYAPRPITLPGNRVYQMDAAGNVTPANTAAEIDQGLRRARKGIANMMGGLADGFHNPMQMFGNFDEYVASSKFSNPTYKKQAELTLTYLESALNALLDKQKTLLNKGGSEGGGGGGETLRVPAVNIGNAPFVAKIPHSLVSDISDFDKEIKGATISVANLQTITDNPWYYRYREEWAGGNGHQRVDFAADAAGTVANGVGSVGNFMQRIPGMENAGAAINDVTGAIMDAIGVIQGISAIIEMVNGIGLAAEVTATNANTAAMFANTAALYSMASAMLANSVSTAIPFFSDGGIIGGNSWTGDKLLARVNSGEMVLNAKQQQNLLAGLNNAGNGGGKLDARMVVKGEDIYVSLTNYLRSTGKRI